LHNITSAIGLVFRKVLLGKEAERQWISRGTYGASLEVGALKRSREV